jgi:hypothetical protein
MHIYVVLAQMLPKFGNGSVRVFHHQMEGVAENGGVEHAGSGLQGLDGRSERIAFNQQQLAFHRLVLEFRGCAQGDHLAAKDQRQAIAVFRFFHVVRGDEDCDTIRRHAMN